MLLRLLPISYTNTTKSRALARGSTHAAVESFVGPSRGLIAGRGAGRQAGCDQDAAGQPQAAAESELLQEGRARQHLHLQTRDIRGRNA